MPGKKARERQVRQGEVGFWNRECGSWKFIQQTYMKHISMVGAVRDIRETYEYDMISALKGLHCLMRENQQQCAVIIAEMETPLNCSPNPRKWETHRKFNLQMRGTGNNPGVF